MHALTHTHTHTHIGAELGLGITQPKYGLGHPRANEGAHPLSKHGLLGLIVELEPINCVGLAGGHTGQLPEPSGRTWAHVKTFLHGEGM